MAGRFIINYRARSAGTEAGRFIINYRARSAGTVAGRFIINYRARSAGTEAGRFIINCRARSAGTDAGQCDDWADPSQDGCKVIPNSFHRGLWSGSLKSCEVRYTLGPTL